MNLKYSNKFYLIIHTLALQMLKKNNENLVLFLYRLKSKLYGKFLEKDDTRLFSRRIRNAKMQKK